MGLDPKIEVGVIYNRLRKFFHPSVIDDGTLLMCSQEVEKDLVEARLRNAIYEAEGASQNKRIKQ